MPNLPKFKNKQLLETALTHRSYVNEHPNLEDNERLEILGDSVLNFIVTSYLYKTYPDLPEGEITRQRSKLVDEAQLFCFAQDLNLGDKIQLGKGAERDGSRQKPSVLSDTLEAILGAYYLDQGIEAVRQYLEPLIASAIKTDATPKQYEDSPHIDPKSRLQQWMLKYISKDNPIYEIISETGPDHDKEFTAKVMVEGQVYGKGKGKSKKEAEKQAATNALRRLGLDRTVLS
ncbi:ribonuclease III [Spirulina sp. CS-785/01]|uniref:ribonuclease III n=1 Tax=Spirulina sp. CS-785/01 TaxID=3021716 RepID=UPI00232EE116|nr:ribonuclease III [Spirulina sp. CS-785/01]MDB9315902.1 ribonuclease III [Spirulina sp. CS-785/01]